MHVPSRLRLVVHCGKHTAEEAEIFIGRIKACSDGAAPLFTSDQLTCYRDLLLEHYSTLEPVPRRFPRGRPPGPQRVPLPGLLYAQVDKQRRQGRVVRVVKRIVIGNETAIRQVLEADGWGTTINTAYVERANGTVRHKNRRLTRKTYGFSKKTDLHRAQLAVETFH